LGATGVSAEFGVLAAQIAVRVLEIFRDEQMLRQYLAGLFYQFCFDSILAMNSASWNGVPLWNCVTEAAAGANEQLYNFDSLAEVIKRYGNPKQRPPGPGCNRCGANHKV